MSVVVYCYICVHLGSVSSKDMLTLFAHSIFVHSALLLLQDFSPLCSIVGTFLRFLCLFGNTVWNSSSHSPSGDTNCACVVCVLNSRHRQFADLVGMLATGCWNPTHICTKTQLEHSVCVIILHQKAMDYRYGFHSLWPFNVFYCKIAYFDFFSRVMRPVGCLITYFGLWKI